MLNKLYKKTNPDLTKEWSFGDPHFTLESAMLSLVDMAAPSKNSDFQKWRKETLELEYENLRKADPNYDILNKLEGI